MITSNSRGAVARHLFAVLLSTAIAFAYLTAIVVPNPAFVA